MPVYLVHGFRWPREGFTGVRVHAIVHNLEDCSAEYIQNENSKRDILDSFRRLHPEVMQQLEKSGNKLDFIEQYDPDDVTSPHAVSQPYAFVADKVVTIAGGTEQTNLAAAVASSPVSEAKGKASMGSVNQSTPTLSVNVEEAIAEGPGLSPQAWEALADLRDKIAEGEKIGWWVVYNGDPDRVYESELSEEDDDEDDEVDKQEVKETSIPKQQFPNAIPPPPSSSIDRQNPTITTHDRVSQPSVPVSAPAMSVQEPPPVPPKEQPPTGPFPSPSTIATTTLPIKQNPSATLNEPTKESIPEPKRLKEISKSLGFRKKFFGRKS